MTDEDIKSVAEGLSEVDREWLWNLPCHSGRAYPMAFIRYGLVESRKRYFIFGPWTTFLNDRGKAVRTYLQEQSNDTN